MNSYIPNEVKNLNASKQRVMQNVVNEIENTSKSPKRPKRKWRYVVIAAVVTMSAMLFVLNEIVIENEQQSATEFALDLTQPIFSEEGLLYLHGVTLGDSQSKVIELLGEDYAVEDYEDGSGADFILDYSGYARFYFYKDKLDSIIFMKVDGNYFDTLFEEFDGVKFISGDHRFIYSKETNHIIKAEYDPDGNLHVSLSHAGPELSENAGFLEWEQNSEEEQQSVTELPLGLTQPTLLEEQGLLYLNGVTLGDSQAKVVELLGEDYTIEDYEDGSGADFILGYGGNARFYFYKDKLDSIIFMKVDENYFDTLFEEYDGFKFTTSASIDDSDRYFYSKETGQLLKATIVPDGNLYLYLMHGGKDLLENPDFPKIEQILD